VRGRKRKPKKEDAAAAAASDLAAAEDAWAEDTVVREAITRPLQDLVPVDNALPMDAALAWSSQDWDRGGGRAAAGPGSRATPHRRRTRHTR
jgi:hypothetical protein